MIECTIYPVASRKITIIMRCRRPFARPAASQKRLSVTRWKRPLTQTITGGFHPDFLFTRDLGCQPVLNVLQSLAVQLFIRSIIVQTLNRRQGRTRPGFILQHMVGIFRINKSDVFPCLRQPPSAAPRQAASLPEYPFYRLLPVLGR